MAENKLLMQRWLLSLYIQERSDREGLDTPEKRLAALNERMKKAKEDERKRIEAGQRGEAA